MRWKSEAIRAKRFEKGKGKLKVKRTSKEKGVDFSEPAKTCEYPAYVAVPTGDHDEKLSKMETREGDFIEALRGMLKPTTDEIKNLGKKVNTLSRIGPSGTIRPPAESPFVPQSVKAFELLKESCNENTGLTEWSDDDDEDKTESSMKMGIPAFEGKDVERFSVTFARYLLLTGEAGPGYRGLRLRILMEVIFSWVFGFHLWVFQTPQKYRRRKRTSVSPLQKPESPAVHDF